jgi:hypothetical protein
LKAKVFINDGIVQLTIKRCTDGIAIPGDVSWIISVLHYTQQAASFIILAVIKFNRIEKFLL